MNWLDALIVVILILSLVMGFINGLVKEVASRWFWESGEP